MHLDLSNNDFSEDACRIMGKSLNKNHTLYGIHMAGNGCCVDSYGYFEFDESHTLPAPPVEEEKGDPKLAGKQSPKVNKLPEKLQGNPH